MKDHGICKIMVNTCLILWVFAAAAVTQAQTVGTATNGDITAKGTGNLTVEGGTINGNDGAALTLNGTVVAVKKNTLSVPNAITLNSPETSSQYELKVDNRIWDGQDLRRLMIRPTDSSQKQSVAICDSGWSGNKGLVVKNQGLVGIGSVDDLSTMTLRDALTIGCWESMVMHEGGVKGIFFNSQLSADGTHLEYISNNPSRTKAPAGGIQMDYLNSMMLLWATQAKGSGQTVSGCRGVVIDADSGMVGLNHGLTRPIAPLDLNGEMIFRNCQDTPGQQGYAMIWADYEGKLHARDSTGDITTFSPHDDPRVVDPQAQTSFGDTAVNLPFSFKQENVYTGKGEVIDMAKLVKWAEAKMKTEMGAKAGQLIYGYDLPEAKVTSEDDREIAIVLSELQSMPAVKVAVGADSKIPPQALEEVDEMRMQTKVIEIPEKKVDFEAGRIVTVMRKTEATTQVRTGRKVKRFREGWSFNDGELYRRPTVDDLDLDALAKKHPRLPQWVRNRMSNRKLSSGQSLSGLVDEIKNRLAGAQSVRSATVATAE